MFWADKVARQLKERNLPLEWVDDMKTPSGRVHVGSMMGVVIHGLVHQSLKDIDVPTKYTFVFENHDPMDDIPSYLPREQYEKYLGMPLFAVPSPEEGYRDFAEYYALEFQKAFNTIGFYPEILWTKDLYTSGKMNDGIRTVLDNADKVRDIYKELYGKRPQDDWYPFQVYCENCGKVSTTKVLNWDGEQVEYKCPVDGIDWTKGCGYEGKVSPFSDAENIRGKMPWKVEWAVKWMAIGITVEGAGKDHMSKGGSHDLASLVAKKVLNYPVPYPVGYEFLLIGGKKMASSKGRGFAAGDMLEILPPELYRFLITKMNIYQQADFDPNVPETIPKLFDEYQEYAKHYFDKVGDDYARTFELSQVSEEIKEPPSIRFSDLAYLVQLPNTQSKIEEMGASEWAKYAKVWVERFAPEKDKFTVTQDLPDSARTLSQEQKNYLKSIADLLSKNWTQEDFQQALYERSKELGLGGKDAFAAIYQSLIGKDFGPRAAEFILAMDHEFVKKRFEEAAST